MPLCLPPEIIAYHLIPLLRPQEVFNLVVALDLEVTQELYNAIFHDRTRYDHYDLKMFQQRAKAHLYMLGEVEYIEDEDYKLGYGPVKIDKVGDMITEVTGGNQTVQALKLDGRVFTVNSETEVFPFETPFEPPEATDGYERWPAENQDKQDLEKYRKRYEQSASGKFFVSVSSSHRGVFAQDDQGLCWKCYNPGEKAHPLLWMDYNKHLVMGNGRQLKSCSAQDACLFQDNVISLGYWLGPGINSYGESLYGKAVSSKGIKDWIILEYWLVYLTDKGAARAIYMPDLHGDDPPLNYINLLPKINALGKFVQISGFDDHFALLSENGEVCVVKFKENRVDVTVETVKGLGKLNIASIAVGKNHYLALTKEGDVYSWGRSHVESTCLGLGNPRTAVLLWRARTKVVRETHGRMLKFPRYLILDTPTKMNLPGKAYAVFAGDDTTALLLGESPKCVPPKVYLDSFVFMKSTLIYLRMVC